MAITKAKKYKTKVLDTDALLRFPHKIDVCFFFTSGFCFVLFTLFVFVCTEWCPILVFCLVYVICVCVHRVVSNKHTNTNNVNKTKQKPEVKKKQTSILCGNRNKASTR
jgi:hypothetical protein